MYVILMRESCSELSGVFRVEELPIVSLRVKTWSGSFTNQRVDGSIPVPNPCAAHVCVCVCGVCVCVCVCV